MAFSFSNLLSRARQLVGHLDFFPLGRALRGYDRAKAAADARAGLNVALLDFPQSLAYALLAGLPVQIGIFTSAVASLVGPLFSSSRFVMLGATNASAVLLLSAFLSAGWTVEQRLYALPLLIVMVGLILVAASFFKLAVFLQYVSRSVLTGYITAAALLIIINQLKTALGLTLPPTATFAETLVAMVPRLLETDLWVAGLATLTACVYWLMERRLRKLPTVALCIVGMSLVVWLAHHFAGRSVWPTVAAAGSAGFSFTPPPLDFALIGQLANSAFALAFLAMLETASIAKNLAARSGDRIDVNQQMFALGVSNLASSCASGMVVSGSLARSTLNFNSGARTQAASLISGGILVAGVVLAAPLIAYIPKATLAVLVIFVGWKLLQPKQIRIIVNATPGDAAAFWLTFGGGLLFPLDTAIYLGVAASIVWFLHKASVPQLVEYAFNSTGDLAAKKEGEPKDTPEISIVHVEGDLFFGSTEIFLDQMRLLVEEPNLKLIILRMKNARHLDATAALAIGDLIRFAREKGREVLVSGAHPEVTQVCRNTGIYDLVGADNFFLAHPDNPNLSTRQALKRAQKLMGEQQANIRLYAKAQPAASAESAAPAAATPTATAATPPSPSAS